MEAGNVNVFNFDEPMHGDIYGFVLQKDDCDGTDPDPAYECPAYEYTEPFAEWAFNDADDGICRSEANRLLDVVQEQYPGTLETHNEFCDLYTGILESLDEQGAQLLDNINFLNAAATVSEF